ncbi:MAG: hypothetical protein IJC23_04260 [Bacteroidaceae bacterium]|nr:hypothetical protein [Bacteroidaceae bacterium]
MRKVILMCLVCFTAVIAQAKILRVSNVAGSSAPYATYEEAKDDALEGDTIIFDGSATSYGDVVVKDKRLVLLGHGYLLAANDVSSLNDCDAIFGNIEIQTKGTIVQGVRATKILIRADNVVVTRCYANAISNGGGYEGYYSGVFSGIVIHQNFVTSRITGIAGSTSQYFSNSQITNNIVVCSQYDTELIQAMRNSVVQNNILINKYYKSETAATPMNLVECMVENNIVFANDKVVTGSKNEISGNIVGASGFEFTDLANDASILDDLKEYTAQGVGAGAGTDPYVISGIPAGPMIEDIDMPTTVEKGKSMEVVVKVKVK